MLIYLRNEDPGKYHKGVIAPLYYRDRVGWPASLPYFLKVSVSVAIGIQCGISLHKRVAIVKIWGPQKMTKSDNIKSSFSLFFPSYCCSSISTSVSQ